MKVPLQAIPVIISAFIAVGFILITRHPERSAPAASLTPSPPKCVCDTENLERRIEQAEHQLERQDSRINRHAFSLHKHNLLEAEPTFRPDCSQGFQPWDGGCVSNEEVIKRNLWGEVKRP